MTTDIALCSRMFELQLRFDSWVKALEGDEYENWLQHRICASCLWSLESVDRNGRLFNRTADGG